MERWQRRTIILSLLVIVLPPALLYYCSRPDYEKQFGPLSADQARRTKELRDFPFPPTAHDIYFAGYVEWKMQEAAIRFDASPEECLATIQKIIEWHEIGTGYRHFDMYPTHPLTGETRLPGLFHIEDVRWWGERLIQRGFVAGGEKCCGKPNVWVDSDLGRVYYYDTD